MHEHMKETCAWWGYVTERRRTSSTVRSGQTQPWTGSAHASRGEFGLEQVLRHDRGEKIREPGHWLTSGHERSVQSHTPCAQTLQTHSSQTLLHITFLLLYSCVVQRSHCLLGPLERRVKKGWCKSTLKRCSESHLNLHLQQQKHSFTYKCMSLNECLRRCSLHFRGQSAL